jgi:epoxyqueuosine reductase QueG
METKDVLCWGVADLQGFDTPLDAQGHPYPLAISFAVPMHPQVMADIQQGPNQAYAEEYAKVNARINRIAGLLTEKLCSLGAAAIPLAASERTDTRQIAGDFPHKTAATRAGLGWIGRNCQLITRPYGPWIRLGTVFTSMDLPTGTPHKRSFCGSCMRCVEACPAQALQGNFWFPGRSREDIIDVWACDAWKKRHYPQLHNGHNCGICSAVCPYGTKANPEDKILLANTNETGHYR